MKTTWIGGVVLVAAMVLGGCGSGGQKENKDFFTSGNKEADQRADQRMVKSQQLSGEGSGNGKKSDADSKNAKGSEVGMVKKSDAKPALYERLGGEEGIARIVDDWMTRALEDPRVNWQRRGVKKGGFSFHRNDSVEWDDSKANVEQLKKHMRQFLSLATGGPSQYDGKEMKNAHAGMHITNAEFDAAVGDLKATLDKMAVANQEQKELLSIVESTREQVAEQR